MDNPLPQLTALLAQLDALADDVQRADNKNQECYYDGAMFESDTVAQEGRR